MQYQVIVEHKNGTYRALLPTLGDLSAEGASRDEALINAQRAATAYLSSVEVTTIDLATPAAKSYSTAQDALRAGGKFKGDEAAMMQHIEEIYAERRHQREEIEREIDEEERKAKGNSANGKNA